MSLPGTITSSTATTRIICVLLLSTLPFFEAAAQANATACDERIETLQPEVFSGYAVPGIAGGLDSLTRRLVYPDSARKAGHEGDVLVQFIVEPDSSIHCVQVLQSAGALLDSAAVNAVRRHSFIPAQTGKGPVPVLMRIPFHFRLDGKKKGQQGDL